MHRIFISYRREDSIETVGRIFDWLDLRLAPNTVFMDVTSIAPGRDFRTAIEQTISSASVLLAIIGPHWLTVREAAGARRLDTPLDFVRTELELALQHGIPIIPVLVQDAKMPSADDLPAAVAPLAYRNAVKVRPNPDFPADMARVLKGIESLAPDIVFSQPAEKGSAPAAGKPADVQPDLPPIPAGGKPEVGFYYTRVVVRQIDKVGAITEDHTVRKEFALRDSPATKHVVAAQFSSTIASWIWEGPVYKLAISVDGRTIADVVLNAKFGAADTWRTSTLPSYDESTIVGGHTYQVKYLLEVSVKSSNGFSGLWAKLWHKYYPQLAVSVDGFTLLDVDSLWDRGDIG